METLEGNGINENVLEWIMVMFVQVSEYTKNDWIVHFGCRVYEFISIKLSFKKIKENTNAL